MLSNALFYMNPSLGVKGDLVDRGVALKPSNAFFYMNPSFGVKGEFLWIRILEMPCLLLLVAPKSRVFVVSTCNFSTQESFYLVGLH